MPSFTPGRSIFRTVALGAVDQISYTGDGSIHWIANRGAVELWVRVDGTDPAATADGSHLILPMTNREFPDPTGNKDVRVTAGAAACAYAAELL